MEIEKTVEEFDMKVTDSTVKTQSVEIDVKEKVTSGSSTTASAVIGLVNTMIGAGLITMPHGFSLVGIGMGILIATFSMIVSIFSLHLIAVVAGHIRGRDTSYFEACRRYFPMGKYVVDFLIFIQGVGTCSAYAILIRDTMPTLFPESSHEIFRNGKIWVSAFILLITYPLSLLRSLRSLRHSSYLAVTLILYLTFLVISFSILRLTDLKSTEDLNETLKLVTAPSSFNNVITCLTYMVFAFTCQQNMFKIFNELKEPRSVKRLTLISVLATAFAGLIYIIFGILGYLTLGYRTKAKLLNEYTTNNDHELDFLLIIQDNSAASGALFVGRLALVFLVTTCFPIQMHPARDSFIQFVRNLYPDRRTSTSRFVRKIKEFNVNNNNILNHFFATTFLCSVVLVIALTVSDPGVVFTLVGGIPCNAIGFLLPALFYMLLDRKPFLKSPKKIFALLVEIFGLLMLIAVIYSVVS